MINTGDIKSKSMAFVIGLIVALVPLPAKAADMSLGSVLLYTGAGCADNSETRINFCLDFRNKDGGFDVTFNEMRFRWTLSMDGLQVSSGGSIASFGSRTGTPASWGFHREEINGLSAGTTYLVTLTVTDGGEEHIRTLTIKTPGSTVNQPVAASESSPISESPSTTPAEKVATGIVSSVVIDGPSQALTGESIEMGLQVVDTNGFGISGKNVSLFVTGPGKVTVATVTTDANGRANFNYFAEGSATGYATIYASANSVQGQKSIEVTPANSESGRFGGYAVVHPSTGMVCGVIVGTIAQVMSTEYMGCPAGSQTFFQTKPSKTGNVAGYHGSDVFYRDGTFYLSWGTITDGIATDKSGRVWDTGTGETLVAGTPAPIGPVQPSQSPTASTQSPAASETEGATEETTEAPQPAPSEAPKQSIAINSDENGVLIRVINGNGMRLSALIGGRWLLEQVGSQDFVARRPAASGQSISVVVYLDGRLVASGIVNSGAVSNNAPTLVTHNSESNSSAASTQSATARSASSEAPQVVQAGQTRVGVGTEGSSLNFRVTDGNGKRLSIRIGGRWFVTRVIGADFTYSAKSIEGQSVPVSIFVDGSLIAQTELLVGSTASELKVDVPTSMTASDTSSPQAEQSIVETPKSDVSSSRGQILVNVRDADGSRISIRIGGRWLVRFADSDDFRVEIPSMGGVITRVLVYVNQKLIQSEVITVRQ